MKILAREQLRLFMIVGDALSIILFLMSNPFPKNNLEMILLTCAILLWWPLSCLLSGAYSIKAAMHLEDLFRTNLHSVIIWIFALLSSTIFVSQKADKIFILTHTGIFLTFIFITRVVFLLIKHYAKNKKSENSRILIIGFNETARKLAGYFEEDDMGPDLVGFIEDTPNIRELSNYPILSPLAETMSTANALKVHEIYSTITPEQNKFIYTLIQEAEKKCMRFKIVPNLSHFIQRPVVTSYLYDMPIISMRKDPLEDPSNRLQKRTLDVIISLIVVVFILSWLYPIIGLMIKIESAGPIIFTQPRTGLNEQAFSCYKFRSMRKGLFDETKQATKNDFRVTKIGAFLRKTSLDEFPQFINVLKGEMSIVGPRPHMMQHTEAFAKLVDHYMIRQLLKPGITGWAQVNGYRGEITEQKQLKMRIANDIWYLENWNIWLDIKIILMTGLGIFKGDKNAY